VTSLLYPEITPCLSGNFSITSVRLASLTNGGIFVPMILITCSFKSSNHLQYEIKRILETLEMQTDLRMTFQSFVKYTHKCK